ncbi:MAG: type II toxin-antitoxin system PemK/MazF family toxin [Acaryochloridaceae cyanobacterium RL_2_7]|nr:type II toxin-antitoxin system PemK/MazF family toxin [Acaryochloridaceae cyanobacterium RL_2_7]
MARFVKGDVVVVPFPFSDLSQAKRRPALVMATLQGNDVILCQITSQQVRDDYAISLTEADFLTGSLRQASNLRPNRIFTADQGILIYKVGTVSLDKMAQVVNRLIKILST